MWFKASCGGRDLLTGNGGTFPGRMSAWCPEKRLSYKVSFSEMGEMSQEARYYVAGFVAGGRRALDLLEYDAGGPGERPGRRRFATLFVRAAMGR